MPPPRGSARVAAEGQRAEETSCPAAGSCFGLAAPLHPGTAVRGRWARPHPGPGDAVRAPAGRGCGRRGAFGGRSGTCRACPPRPEPAPPPPTVPAALPFPPQLPGAAPLLGVGGRAGPGRPCPAAPPRPRPRRQVAPPEGALRAGGASWSRAGSPRCGGCAGSPSGSAPMGAGGLCGGVDTAAEGIPRGRVCPWVSPAGTCAWETP